MNTACGCCKVVVVKTELGFPVGREWTWLSRWAINQGESLARGYTSTCLRIRLSQATLSPALWLCRGRVFRRGAVVARRVWLVKNQQIWVLWGCPEAGVWVACAWPGSRVCTPGGSCGCWHRCPAPWTRAGRCGGLSTSGDGIKNGLPGWKNTGQPSGCPPAPW